MRKVIIVGGGVAGLSAALELGQLGYDVSVLEGEPHSASSHVYQQASISAEKRARSSSRLARGNDLCLVNMDFVYSSISTKASSTR